MKFICKISINILVLASLFINATAQTLILNRTVEKIASSRNISYNASSKSKNPFSDELYNINVNASFALQNNQLLYSISRHTTGKDAFDYADKEIYNGKDLLQLSMNNNTYSTKENYKEVFNADYSIFTIADQVKGHIKNQDNIIQLSDSVVNHILCYHIIMKTIDSVVKKTGSYFNQNLLISKVSNLPVYCQTNSQGVAEKGGMKIGTIKMFSETYFTNYRLNQTMPGRFALKIPAGFVTEKPPLALLTKGTSAPEWKLTTADGKILSISDLKGKVVLLDVTSTSCAACMLSVPSLNNLHERYKGTDVAIVSINLDDTKDAIIKFITKYHVLYTVYLNGNTIKAAYHIGPIPTFYIINKQGYIDQAYDGYFENFEQEMVSKIDKLR